MVFYYIPLYVHLHLSLDPVIVKEADPGVQLKALLIAAKTDCVLVGDSDGQVTVYKIQNLKDGGSNPVSLRGTWSLRSSGPLQPESSWKSAISSVIVNIFYPEQKYHQSFSVKDVKFFRTV